MMKTIREKFESYSQGLIDFGPGKKSGRIHWQGYILPFLSDSRSAQKVVEAGQKIIELLNLNYNKYDHPLNKEIPPHFKVYRGVVIEANKIKEKWYLKDVFVFSTQYYAAYSAFSSLKQAFLAGEKIADFVLENPEKFEDWGLSYTYNPLGRTIYIK